MLQCSSQEANALASPTSSPERFLAPTDHEIQTCPVQAKRVIYRFESLPGLGLRVTPQGTKTWIFTYKFEETNYMLSFGRYPKTSLGIALSKYMKAKEDLNFGLNPSSNAIKRSNTCTIKELVDRYIHHCQKTGKKDWKAERGKFEKDLIPRFGKKKIHLVTADDLREMFDHIIFERNAPGSASHLYAYTRRMFNYAGDMRINRMKRRDNPCLDVRLGIKTKSKTRHLTTREIYTFWHGLDNANLIPSVRQALRFILCTVARGGEVRALKWSDIDLNECVWTLKETKNGKPHRVHISELAKGLLNSVGDSMKEGDIVFRSSRYSSLCGYSLSDGCLSQAIRKNFNCFGIAQPFTPHDLRRTSATIVAALTRQKASVKRVLNHVDNDVTDIYDQYAYDHEKKASLYALNYALERIISCKSILDVPSLEQIRAELKGSIKEKSFEPFEHSLKDSPTTLSSPVSYTLSYDPVRL